MENQEVIIQDVTQKPQSVTTAVTILWVTLAVGLVKILINFAYLSVQATWFTYVILIFTYAVIGFFIFKISAGKNWARIVFLVLFVLGMLPTVFAVPKEFAQLTILGVLSVAQIGLQAYALYLLFTKPGSTWFGK